MKNERKTTCELLQKMPGFCVRVPCDRCIFRFRANWLNVIPENGVHRYKGYVLLQNSTGNYYIFSQKTGKFWMHAICDKLLSRKEAREHIDFYLSHK